MKKVENNELDLNISASAQFLYWLAIRVSLQVSGFQEGRRLCGILETPVKRHHVSQRGPEIPGGDLHAAIRV